MAGRRGERRRALEGWQFCEHTKRSEDDNTTLNSICFVDFRLGSLPKRIARLNPRSEGAAGYSSEAPPEDAQHRERASVIPS